MEGKAHALLDQSHLPLAVVERLFPLKPQVCSLVLSEIQP